MSPPQSQNGSAANGLRQVAHRPHASDGVGDALRQIFGGSARLPSEFGALLCRLDKGD